MTPSTEHLLLNEIQPRLRNAIVHRVPVVGSDDHEELLQDGLVIALRLLNGARRSRKNVTGASVAYYAVKCLRAVHDVMSPESSSRAPRRQPHRLSLENRQAGGV